MKKLISLVLTVSLTISQPAKADMFGGDLVFLAQILANAIKQYIELKNILENGRDQLDLIRQINEGVNDSLRLARTINPNIDPGIYKDWQNASDALIKLQAIYGIVTNSPDSKVYSDTDQNVAEAVTLNNDIYKYTQNIDELGEVIKSNGFSHILICI